MEGDRGIVLIPTKETEIFSIHQNQSTSPKCIYCIQEDHKASNQPTKVSDVAKTRRLLSTKRLCFICTKSGHLPRNARAETVINEMADTICQWARDLAQMQNLY